MRSSRDHEERESTVFLAGTPIRIPSAWFSEYKRFTNSELAVITEKWRGYSEDERLAINKDGE